MCSSFIFIFVSVPTGQPVPRVVAEAETSVSLEWDGPLVPNGVITSFLLHRRTPSLSPSPSLHDVGVAFSGGSGELATFSGEPSLLGGFSNEVTLRFRTLQAYGTILYYINSPRTDVFAIELRNGIPWFVFDAGSGPAAIRPDENISFSDGFWHELTVTQVGRAGSIIVDQIYTGSGESIGTDQVISSRQTLAVGSLPPEAPPSTISGGLNPNATLRGESFAGCLFGITINGQLLDFASQDPSTAVVGPELGCPIELQVGVHFLGGGYLTLAEDTITSSRFRFTFNIRTTHALGLLLFAYDSGENADSAFGVELRNGSLLSLVASSGGSQFEQSITEAAVCDGEWHSITVEQSGSEFSLILDDAFSQTVELPVSDALFSSQLFLGGVPLESAAFSRARSIGLNVYASFSGCVRSPSLSLDGGQPAAVPLPRLAGEQVRFDGCPGGSEGGVCSPPWRVLDAGTSTSLTDAGLNPFTGEQVSSHTGQVLMECSTCRVPVPRWLGEQRWEELQ